MPSPVPPRESELSLSVKAHKVALGQLQREGLQVQVQANSGQAGRAGRYNSGFVVQNFQRISFVKSHIDLTCGP